jgi:hypothetical protein
MPTESGEKPSSGGFGGSWHFALRITRPPGSGFNIRFLERVQKDSLPSYGGRLRASAADCAPQLRPGGRRLVTPFLVVAGSRSLGRES